MPQHNASFPSHVQLREAGLRDGLQSISSILPTAHKLDWIRAGVAQLA